MNRNLRIAVAFVLALGLVAGTAITALAAQDQVKVQSHERNMNANQIRHQARTAAQQDQYLASSGPVVGLNADRDQDRLKDGTGDGDPDRDRVRLQDRIMDCVDQFCDWLRGTGSR